MHWWDGMDMDTMLWVMMSVGVFMVIGGLCVLAGNILKGRADGVHEVQAKTGGNATHGALMGAVIASTLASQSSATDGTTTTQPQQTDPTGSGNTWSG